VSIRCDVCGSVFLDFELDPGRGQRVYNDHKPYCDAKADLKRLKKKSKPRAKELPGIDEKWEVFNG
jgi:hypothetical protein